MNRFNASQDLRLQQNQHNEQRDFSHNIVTILSYSYTDQLYSLAINSEALELNFNIAKSKDRPTWYGTNMCLGVH